MRPIDPSGGDIELVPGTERKRSLFADDLQREGFFSFTAKEAWSSSIVEKNSVKSASNPAWIRIFPDQGDAGTHSVNLILANNYSEADRTAEITLTSGGSGLTLTVTQKATKLDEVEVVKTVYTYNGGKEYLPDQEDVPQARKEFFLKYDVASTTSYDTYTYTISYNK